MSQSKPAMGIYSRQDSRADVNRAKYSVNKVYATCEVLE